MYKTGFMIIVIMMLYCFGLPVQAADSAPYSVSVVDEISPDTNVLFSNAFNQSMLKNCRFTDNWNSNTATVNQGWLSIGNQAGVSAITTPAMTLPALKAGQTKSLFLTFDETYNMEYEKEFGSIYINTPKGRFLMDVRTGLANDQNYAIDITAYAGQTVSFEYELRSETKSNDSWKIKNQAVLQDMSLEGEIKSITSKYIRERDHQFVYVDLTINGNCPKIDEFSELNFDVKEEDRTKAGVWNTQDIYMFATPEEASNISALDLVICIDATISMRDRISDIEENIKDFLTTLDESGIDHRVAFIVFGDEVELLEEGQFISNPYQMQKVATTISEYSSQLDEGPNKEENQFGAINVATGLKFREEAKKAIMLITESASLVNSEITNPANQNLEMCQYNLRRVGAAFYPVFDIYDATQRDQYIPLTSDAQNVNCSGKFYHIDNDFEQIMEDMKNEIVNTYKIVYRVDNTDQKDTLRNVKVKVSYDSVIK